MDPINSTSGTSEIVVNDHPNVQTQVPLMEQNASSGYELGGKIMLSAIVILFAVVVFILVLHLYTRWYLIRQRRRELRRRRSRNRRAQIVFYIDDNQAGPVASRGLEPAVIGSLPVFEYSSKDRTEPVECAVCLSEFEDNEKGRLLPKCNHSFHTECIDMWFYSHSTCPLCRSAVEAFNGPDKNPDETIIKVNEPMAGNGAEPGSSSGLCSEGKAAATSLGSRRKGLDLSGVRVEVPARNELDPEFPLSSPASCGFRSPGSRLLSLKRILSMNKRTPSGPSTPLPLSTEFDLECGGSESGLARAHTPR